VRWALRWTSWWTYILEGRGLRQQQRSAWEDGWDFIRSPPFSEQRPSQGPRRANCHHSLELNTLRAMACDACDASHLVLVPQQDVKLGALCVRRLAGRGGRNTFGPPGPYFLGCASCFGNGVVGDLTWGRLIQGCRAGAGLQEQANDCNRAARGGGDQVPSRALALAGLSEWVDGEVVDGGISGLAGPSSSQCSVEESLPHR